MRLKRTLLVATLLAIAFGQSLPALPSTGQAAPDIVPDKTWNDEGRKNLSDYQDEWVLVVTWATW